MVTWRYLLTVFCYLWCMILFMLYTNCTDSGNNAIFLRAFLISFSQLTKGHKIVTAKCVGQEKLEANTMMKLNRWWNNEMDNVNMRNNVSEQCWSNYGGAVVHGVQYSTSKFCSSTPYTNLYHLGNIWQFEHYRFVQYII